MNDPFECESKMQDPFLRYHSEHLLEAQEVDRQPFKSSGFGRLPTELRNQIYDLVIAFNSSIKDKPPYWLVEQ